MTRMMRLLGVAVVLISAGTGATAWAEDDPWEDFRFLLGSWVSEAGPEQGTGRFTLEPDLEGKILVRRNVADLPAANGRPAGTHEDLMVIYRDPDSSRSRASYFDSEGHVISYDVAPLSDGKGLEFVSSPAPAAPRFRLTYTKAEGEKVEVRFEIAPPGKPEEFRTYLEGTVRREKPSR